MNKLNLLFLSSLLYITTFIHLNAAEFEEAPLNINLKTLKKNINVKFIYKENKFYAPFKDLFDVFKIENIYLKNDNKMIGFYPFSDDKYEIDFNNSTYNIRGKTGRLEPGTYFFHNKKFYIETELLNKLFNLNMIINFSDLSLNFLNEEELPVVRNFLHEQRQNSKNKTKKNKIKYDYFVKDKKTYFRTGRVGLEGFYTYSTPLGKNVNNPDFLEHKTSQSLYGGFELGKGDFYFNLTGNHEKYLNIDNSNFNLKYILPEQKYFKVMNIGDVSSGGLYGKSFKGVSVSNNYRPYMGEFNKVYLQKFTFPNSYIEVYRNNVNIINIKSDSKGFYKTEIPIFYGNNEIEIKIYGPHGERDNYKFIHNIKSNLLKDGQYLYDFSLGNTAKTDTSEIPNTTYAAANGKYGINNDITIRGGFIASDKEDTETVFGPKKDINANSFYTGLDANYKGNYNYSNTFKYDDYFLNSVNYMSDIYYINAYYKYALQDNQQDSFSVLSYIQLEADNLRFQYQRFFATDLIDNGYDVYKTSFMTRLSQRIFSDVSFIYETFDNQAYRDDMTINYRLGTTLFYRWLPKFLRNIDISLSGNYSLIEGFKNYNLKIEKEVGRKTKYTFFYNKEFYSNNDKEQVRLELTQDFDKFYGIVNTSYFVDNSFNVQVGLGVNIGYNDKLNHIYFSSWKDIGRGEVSVIPYDDKDNDNKFSNKDKVLEEANIYVNAGKHLLHHDNKVYHTSNVIPYEDNNIKGNEFTDGEHLFVPKYKYIGFEPRPNLFTTVYYPFVKTGIIEANVINKKYNKIISGIILELHNLKTKEVSSAITDLDGEVYFDKIIPGDYILLLNREQMGDLRFKSEKYNVKITKDFFSNKNAKPFTFYIEK